MATLEERVRAAVRSFWTTRSRQAVNQGKADGRKDQGDRAAVTGGAHLDGFRDLLCSLLVEEAKIPSSRVHVEKGAIQLPGYFRPEKQWDVVVVVDEILLGAVEFKAQVGSFGNNCNNRAEEAVGNAHDYWTAFRDGAFRSSPRPWLGYMMLLEEAPGSTRPVRVSEPHFKVFDVFRNASYAQRYEILLTRLIRERMYDAACLLMSGREAGLEGRYREPVRELSFRNFAMSFVEKALAFTRTQR